tara:strand:- start:340 stop:519 length:180 start_codon:yes stop_codon:yes gene_type:complete
MDDLLDALVHYALQLSNMPEEVPTAYLTLEERLKIAARLQVRRERDCGEVRNIVIWQPM